MIDSHAHLTMFPGSEREDAIRRAVDAGVHRILVPATGPEDAEEVIRVAEEGCARAVAAVGFHPHEARHLQGEWKRRLAEMVDHPAVVAVGEIGLDYHYDYSPREDQRRAFRWQLGLARERGLPVVLHHREAWTDFLADLDSLPGIRGVAHSFTEGADGVRAVVARGLWVGISGMVTFPRGENVRAAAAAVPRGRLLVETDSPYLAPVPHRGSRNEPALVARVLAAVAVVRGEEPEAAEMHTDAAFADLFAVPPGADDS